MRLVSSRVHFPGFRCSLGDQSINALVFLKHIFQNEEQEEKDGVEKERLERKELLHQQDKGAFLSQSEIRFSNLPTSPKNYSKKFS